MIGMILPVVGNLLTRIIDKVIPDKTLAYVAQTQASLSSAQSTRSAYLSSQWKHILWTEALFLALFLISLRIRLGNPDLWHPWLRGEKPMDFSFFNAVLRTVYFPPEHPWFAGHYINYYYYGFIMAAIPTKLLGILPVIAYNVIIPTWFAMTGIGVFSVAFNLMAGLRKNPAEETPALEVRSAFFNRKSLPYFAGVVALIAVLLLGNLYQVVLLWRFLPEASERQKDKSHATLLCNQVKNCGMLIARLSKACARVRRPVDSAPQPRGKHSILSRIHDSEIQTEA